MKKAKSKKAVAPKTKGAQKTRKPKKAAPAKIKKSTEKLGILGGAFNPIHVGHLNAALTVKQKLSLDRVILLPLNRAPHRDVAGPTEQERLELVDLAVGTYKPDLEVSDMEIKRGGVSFTVDTLRELGARFKPENLYFIMGADAFKDFTTWREFETLLSLANFVVTTRPGSPLSLFSEDLNPELQKYIKKSDGKTITLKTKRSILKLELEDKAVSSTEVRKRLRAGGDVRTMVPPKVLDQIKKQGFYSRSVPAVRDYRAFAILCAQMAQDKKAQFLKVYNMSQTSSYVDFSVICSATSTRQASAIAGHIIEKVKEEYGIRPISLEGAQEGQWVLIDYGPVVVHVFEDSMRTHYRLEELWKNSPLIQVEQAKN